MQFRILAADAQERSALAAIRCLSASGFAVTAVGTTRQAPGLWSLAPARRWLAADPQVDTEAFIRRAETILRRTPHDLLLPGADASLFAVSRHRSRLEPYVRLGLPSHAAVERSLDREQLGIEAAQVGLSFPEGRTCGTGADAVRAARELGYPVPVKPVQTVVESAGALRRRSTVLAEDDRAVESAAGAFESCIVQRRLEGSVLVRRSCRRRAASWRSGLPVLADLAAGSRQCLLLGDDRLSAWACRASRIAREWPWLAGDVRAPAARAPEPRVRGARLQPSPVRIAQPRGRRRRLTPHHVEAVGAGR